MRVTPLPPRRSPGVRLVAAVAALLTTTALVLELARLPPAAAPVRAPVGLPVTLMPAPPPPAAAAAPVRARAAARAPAPQPVSAPIAPPRPPAVAQPVARSEPPSDAASAPPPPLRLGAEVMRQAARDSLAQTRRLAAQAGLDDAPVSGAERLADGVRQSAKPDCLAANAGGSLLSLPIIALQALRQKCQ